MSHGYDEMLHLMMQQVHSQTSDLRFTMWGHIARYNEENHAVQVVIPTYSGDDGHGNTVAVQTGWIPLGSNMVGNNFGIQYRPHGGATAQNPTQGEKVMLSMIERDGGQSVVANLCFSDAHRPPSYQLMNTANALAAGELLIQHESGSYARFMANGDIQFTANRDIVATAGRDANVTAQRHVNATATTGNVTAAATVGNVNITAGNTVAVTSQGAVTVNAAAPGVTVTSAGPITVTATTVTVTATGTVAVNAPRINAGTAAVNNLMKDVMIPIFNAHVHTDPQGGSTGPPTTLLAAGSATNVLFGV